MRRTEELDYMILTHVIFGERQTDRESEREREREIQMCLCFCIVLELEANWVIRYLHMVFLFFLGFLGGFFWRERERETDRQVCLCLCVVLEN